MKLSIITLNYKKKELTLSSVLSTYQQYQKQFEKDEFEIIVVDNCSKDASVVFLKKAFLKQKLRNVYIYETAKNVGFSGGCNFGEEKSKGNHLLFLNNDTKVLDSGFIGMLDFMDSRPQVGVLGGRMENENRTSQASAGKFYILPYVFLMLMGLQRVGLLYTSPSQIKKVDWVSGGCMMVRRDIFKKVGGFDMSLFMYMEDVDICYRIKKMRYFTYFYPFVSVMHIGQGSANRTFAIVHIYEGLMYFYKKHQPYWQTWLLACILKAKAKTLILVGKLIGNTYLISTYEKALTSIR